MLKSVVGQNEIKAYPAECQGGLDPLESQKAVEPDQHSGDQGGVEPAQPEDAEVLNDHMVRHLGKPFVGDHRHSESGVGERLGGRDRAVFDDVPPQRHVPAEVAVEIGIII